LSASHAGPRVTELLQALRKPATGKAKAPFAFRDGEGDARSSALKRGSRRKSKAGFYYAGPTLVIARAVPADHKPGPTLPVSAVELGKLLFFASHFLCAYRKRLWLLKFGKGQGNRFSLIFVLLEIQL